MSRLLRRTRLAAGVAPPPTPPPEPPPGLTISTFFPQQAPVGTQVMVVGNFGSVGTVTGARIGGALSVFTQISSTQVLVAVPSGTLGGKIRIETAAGFALSVADFILGNFVHRGTAELPRVTPQYTPSNATTGTVHSPTTAAQLQTLLAGGNIGTGVLAAGDTIILQRGTTYNSPSIQTQFVNPPAGSLLNPIKIMTSGLNSGVSPIPAPGQRITDFHRAAAPHFRMQAANTPALWVGRLGGGGVTFVGIEADAGTVTSSYGVVVCGPIAEGPYSTGSTYGAGFISWSGWVSLQSGNVGNPQVDGSAWWRRLTANDWPDKIIFDRCDIAARLHSNRSRHVLRTETKELQTHGCFLWSEGVTGDEDKAWSSITSIGPILHDNTQFTAAAINALTGGSDPAPSMLGEFSPRDQDGAYLLMNNDMTFRRCYFFKPLRFIPTRPEWDGLVRLNKNLFEFKTARRSLVEDCLFENDYEGGTSQFYSIVFKVSNQNGTFNEAATHHVTFRFNRLKNVNGVLALGTEDTYSGGTTLGCRDFSIYNCYTEGLGGVFSANGARAWQIAYLGRMERIHLENLTLASDHPRVVVMTAYNGSIGLAPAGFVVRNCILDFGTLGFRGEAGSLPGIGQFSGAGSSAAGVVLYAPGQNPSAALYPASSFIVRTNPADVYVDRAGGNFRPAAALAGVGFEGRTPGADIDEINARTAGCVTGVWT